MRTALTNLAKMMVRPRATVRRILDAGRDRWIIPLVVLTAISGFVADFDGDAIDAMSRQRVVPFPLLLVLMLLVASLAALLIFYILSWAAYGIGKVMEGTGTPREVRSAIAWGQAPLIWALLYRLPAVIFWPRARSARFEIDEAVRFDPASVGSSCLTTSIFIVIEVMVFIWTAAVMSNAVGEAHRFSSWRGLGTLCLVAISPIILVVAAVLAM